jgi:hypothetical protein
MRPQCQIGCESEEVKASMVSMSWLAASCNIEGGGFESYRRRWLNNGNRSQLGNILK